MSILYKMQHLFAYQRDTFLAHYHKRSNVDTTFSMIKRKFGDSLRSKSDVGQMNEILLQGDRTQLVRADLLRVRGRTVDAEVRESGDCVGL
jgi:transposase